MNAKRSDKAVYLLDGFSLIFKTYFAFINRPLINSRGENTTVVFGFFRSLFSFIEKYRPPYFAVVMDSPVPTFRHERYPLYKATREKAPEDLKAQIPWVSEILKALGVPALRKDRYEADDLLAAAARLCRQENRDCFIISSDKDLLQLVGGRIKILRPDSNGYNEIDEGGVKAAWGVRPDQIQDFLALTGDTADNIPGVKGIGEKNAQALLSEYETLPGIYEHLENLTPTQRKKLEEGRESAFLSRELAGLAQETDIGLSLEDLSLRDFNKEAALPLFERFEIASLVKTIREDLAFPSPPGVSAQGELFAPAPGKEPSGDSAAGTGRLPSGALPAPPKPAGLNYSPGLTLKDLDGWIKKCRRAGIFAFDCETTGLDELTARLVGFSLSTAPGEGVYFPVSAPGEGGGAGLTWEAAKPRLKALLEDPGVKAAGQNIKFDYKVLKNAGITIKNIGFDTMTAAWLLDPGGGKYGMEALALRYLDLPTISYDEVVKKGQTFDQVGLEEAVRYAAEDADVTFRLFEFFEDRLKKENLSGLYYSLELPLIKILSEMEYLGIAVNKEILKDYSGELEERLKGIEAEIFRICGHEFNIQSPKQLQTVLFEERGLFRSKKIKTGYSTDSDVLEELAQDDPVPELILAHRGLSKIKSTYSDALPEMINPATGRIHTRFIQTGTATGRMSSKEPNLQNIPIKTADGRRIRSAFVPGPGFVFISADYSQIELAVLAHLSGDPALREAFINKEDIHRQTAALIFDCPQGEVNQDQRRIAKTINFGVMYGMSSFRLSRELKIPRKQAEGFINSYFSRYGGIRQYMDGVIREAETTGCVRTLLGRRREIRGINSQNKTEKAGAQRIAINTPIQGSAADIMKLAMIGVDKNLRQEGLKSRILLQVHDELLLEAPREEQERVEALLRETMEGVYRLSIPLKVSVETGENWGELH
ncbi:MAG: DNA polymerase I [Spirochaetales bacterium]|jgi:DNA polymerase-1|nr:DNA polymerase I [Spirochaetales bacterium]